MGKLASFYEVRELLLAYVKPIGTKEVDLEKCGGRILGQTLIAQNNVPPFHRSPYDGYAFWGKDTQGASPEQPITFPIQEEIPAGSFPREGLAKGCAVKVSTGAPIPFGADAVLPYEKTVYTANSVTIFTPVEPGSNVIWAGEDVKIGEVLAKPGIRIDPGLAGTLAAQNLARPVVYRIPRIGILSTGSELQEIGSKLETGKVYNTNQYMLSAAVEQLGGKPIGLGVAKDCPEEICVSIAAGLEICDLLLVTGGVSVGDYDVTPKAMEMAGVKILQRGVALKPGMACTFGRKGEQLVCGLSGNPASAITNFYAIVSPVIRKLAGCSEFIPREFPVKLLNAFPKSSQGTRLLRGKIEVSDEGMGIWISKEQGNVVLSSTIGCNGMAIVPAGSGPLAPGTQMKGFFL